VTDFFANLAARASDEVGMVRPRLPALFEPLPPEPVLEPAPAFETEIADETWRDPQPQAQPEPRDLFASPPPGPHPPAEAPAPHPLPGAPRALPEPEDPFAFPRPRPDPPAEAPVPHPPPGTPRSTAEASPRPVATPRIVPVLPALPPASRVAATDAPRAIRPVPQPIAILPSVPPEPPQEQPHIGSPAHLLQDEPQPPRVSHRTPGTELTTPREAPIPRVAKAVPVPAVASEIVRPAPVAPPPTPLLTSRGERAQRDGPFQHEPAPRAEATIHVSIGRIEVRATPAPPARDRAQAASPVMSLEEYLRTRAGRARS
jgi:hypothetical protein